jgi:hypothetical protein
VHRGVSMGDSDVIRVRNRAWEPGRIGMAEPRVPAGRGDPCTAGGSDRVGVAVAPRAGPGRVGAREKALPEELGCGMRIEDAHRHEIKVGACEWRAHTDTKEKLMKWTPVKLGWVKGAIERSEGCRV